MKKAVICKQIKKSYGEGEAEVQALRGVDLDVYSGELLMLVGPSGCGKTTLLSVISAILHQDSGECLVYGTSLNQLPDRQKTAFRASHIGFVFQAFNLIPMLNSTENAAIPLVLQGMQKEEALHQSQNLLTELGLKNRLEAYPFEMSGGEQQRVAIARSMIHHPKLIVIDEPTSALDHKTGQHVLELLREIPKEIECSMIIVTHDARIFQFADRILEMEDGRILREERNHLIDANLKGRYH